MRGNGPRPWQVINRLIAVDANAWRGVLLTVATIAIEWLCLLFLWRKKVFIKV